MRGQLFETTKLPHTNFAGKTIVITGANTGLGFECAKQVYVSQSQPGKLSLGTNVIVVRSSERPPSS